MPFCIYVKRINMLTFQSHPQEAKAMQIIINSGRYFSITFIKADNSIRYANGHKHIYSTDSSDEEKRGKYNRLDKNVLLVWDNNKIDPVTNEKGAYIQARLDRILYFKSGEFTKDYTEENQQAVQAAKITPDQLEEIRGKMKMTEIIQEEMQSMLEGVDYQKFLGKSIEKTQQIIDQANADNIIAIEPDSTWETNYKFQKVVLMGTRLRVQYQEDNGRGWKPMTDDVNLTQDRLLDFDEAKYTLAWIRRSIKRGYTEDRRDTKRQDQLDRKSDLQESSEMLGIADLAEFLSRVSPNVTQEGWQEVLQDMYQQEGDEGVRNMFRELTKGTDLQILGRGKYALKF
jgi:hypothetical protein